MEKERKKDRKTDRREEIRKKNPKVFNPTFRRHSCLFHASRIRTAPHARALHLPCRTCDDSVNDAG